MKINSLVSRWLPIALGALLMYSGGYKLFLPGEATFALEAVDAPVRVAKAAVFSVTVIELYLGLILLTRLNLRFALSFSMALFLAFTIFLW